MDFTDLGAVAITLDYLQRCLRCLQVVKPDVLGSAVWYSLDVWRIANVLPRSLLYYEVDDLLESLIFYNRCTKAPG